MAIRPAYPQQRPLSALSTLLGVRLTAVGHSHSPNDLGFLSGLTLDSRSVRPGDLYVALPGARVHGAAFCADAVAAGAVAVLTDPDGRARATASGVPVFVLADPRTRLGEIACWVYGDPSGRLRLIGVTGTSGKTTSTYLLESGLRAAGHLTGLVGGVELRIGQERLASSLTTPEAPDLQALFAVMVERGVTAAAMEVSSHSLSLGRVAGTRFDVAVFTNLSQDHLDFHADLEDYFRAKASLFMPPVIGVVNIDDKYGRKLASSAPPQGVPVTTFSASGADEADWRAADVRSGKTGGRPVTAPRRLNATARMPPISRTEPTWPEPARVRPTRPTAGSPGSPLPLPLVPPTPTPDWPPFGRLPPGSVAVTSAPSAAG